MYYMANNRYRNGRAFEYRVRDHFIGQGYYVVRAAGSKGKADLVALRAGQPPTLIQCKGGAITKTERDEAAQLHEIAEIYGARALLVGRDKAGKLLVWATSQDGLVPV